MIPHSCKPVSGRSYHTVYQSYPSVMDVERLKKPDGRPDYFDELLSQIRDIRASEKRFYQKRA